MLTDKERQSNRDMALLDKTKSNSSIFFLSSFWDSLSSTHRQLEQILMKYTKVKKCV